MSEEEVRELLKTARNANEAFLIIKKSKLGIKGGLDLWYAEERRRTKEYFRDRHRREINRAIYFLKRNGYKVVEEDN